MKDLFSKIFLTVCLHLAVSVVTIVIYEFLGQIGYDGSFYSGLWVCLFVTNCTTLIMTKLHRIQSRLPAEEAKD